MIALIILHFRKLLKLAIVKVNVMELNILINYGAELILKDFI